MVVLGWRVRTSGYSKMLAHNRSPCDLGSALNRFALCHISFTSSFRKPLAYNLAVQAKQGLELKFALKWLEFLGKQKRKTRTLLFCAFPEIWELLLRNTASKDRNSWEK